MLVLLSIIGGYGDAQPVIQGAFLARKKLMQGFRQLLLKDIKLACTKYESYGQIPQGSRLASFYAVHGEIDTCNFSDCWELLNTSNDIRETIQEFFTDADFADTPQILKLINLR
jgi:hypothetical protein